jgi:NAD(P)-dependent dehydrogenase (short-subunit alcohol dehydrogenase family)
MNVNFEFNGQTALVTGAGSGIGRATAIAFAAHGARVMVADTSEELGLKTVSDIRNAGGEAEFVLCDITMAQAVEKMVARTIKTFGSLDIAVNNAGINSPESPVAEIEESDFDRVLSVNLKGVWLCMKYEILQMIKQGRGAIVNMSSTCGLVGVPGAAPYVSSKHGVNGLTKTAALEYATAGIRINAVCPGVIRTPLTEPALADPEKKAQVVSLHPIGRIGEPEEVAGAVMWLASDCASFVTGSTQVVDGGWTAY